MLKGILNFLINLREAISDEMTTAITSKFDRIGIQLVNFNIINISFQSDLIENAIETTQILGQKIEEMEFIKLSKETQLNYLKQTNIIYDTVNKSVEVTKGEVNKIRAAGIGKGKSKLYENVASSITDIKTKTGTDDDTFLFLYLGIFKNTFNDNQNVYITKNAY